MMNVLGAFRVGRAADGSRLLPPPSLLQAAVGTLPPLPEGFQP